MRGPVQFCHEISGPSGSALGRAREPAAPAAGACPTAELAAVGAAKIGHPAGALTGFPPVRGVGLGTRSRLSPLILISIAGVGGGVLAGGLRPGTAWAVTVGLLALAAALPATALSERIRGQRVVVLALVVVGLCGAGLDWHGDDPGYVVSYVSLAGLALRTPRRVALLAGTPVVAAVTAAEAYDSANPADTTLTVLSAFGFVFMISALAAVSLDARHRAEARLAQQAAASEARERAAAAAERSRLARDLHDVLDHGLSLLAVQLEAARLTAITTAAGADLVGQITCARRLTRIGMLNARRALVMLRDDDPPGPANLPDLVSETALVLGIPIALDVDGVPCVLEPDAGVMVYRAVQEALTNVARHAGRGVRVTVRLAWASDGVAVSIVDSGGDGTDAGLPSGGFGLTGMAERAALKGGSLRAGRSGTGFTVDLWLPAAVPAGARAS